ncbi:MAG TPA: class I SAM-dependent methyltransferase [Gaiellaceae bacterium]|nr:class I SAM-dependent methyltransferase [Gaiellaceae bacterium]
MSSDGLVESAGLGLEIQRRLGAVENYNAWIASQFLPHAGRRVLDVGCARGNITRFFLDRERVIGIDIARDFVDEIRGRFASVTIFDAFQADIADEQTVPMLRAEDIDTVLCVNVLEHIEDDVRALRNMRSILVPDGRLLLLVPAFPGLFGAMDRADSHFRRYTRKTLITALGQAALTIESLQFMNVLGIVGWALNGKLLHRSLIPEGQYGFYDRLVPMLSRVEAALRVPFGLSLVAVARRIDAV